MRFQIQACFDTEANGLTLSAEASECSAVLIADDCAVELLVVPVKNGATGASGALPTIHTLMALPWDSSRMRLCVNGISYGTGPLVLRDGDRLTLHPSHTTGPKTLYTYAVSAVPTPENGDANEVRDSVPLAACALASEENDRLRVIISNVEQYAKWNNFYCERFTNLTTTRPPLLNGAHSSVQFRKCVCGSYVTAEVGASGVAPPTACAPDATQTPAVLDTNADVSHRLPSAHARTLVTLLSSVPQPLELGSSAPQPQAEVDVYLPAVCCCCPFASASSDRELRLCTKKPSCASAAMPSEFASEDIDSQKVRKASPPSCADARETSWAAYARARQGDLVATRRVGHAKKSVDEPDTHAFVGGAPLGRPTWELLNRISFLESALTGIRYE
ncbi:hypothetical protein CUR178_01538 [Leishmania enriettii]|uniref:FHA domain-containing protein n=1 Tax=Leishmania enriettii TaxID=5663 RepID=A0A836H2C7_LEIEN|nr:hypothetical protein CUR178_01538 [Leishmania enriettii]